MGQEHVGKGVNIALGPMMNLGRYAQGGRNWEGFGAVGHRLRNAGKLVSLTHTASHRIHTLLVRQPTRQSWACSKPEFRLPRSTTY